MGEEIKKRLNGIIDQNSARTSNSLEHDSLRDTPPPRSKRQRTPIDCDDDLYSNPSRQSHDTPTHTKRSSIDSSKQIRKGNLTHRRPSPEIMDSPPPAKHARKEQTTRTSMDSMTVKEGRKGSSTTKRVSMDSIPSTIDGKESRKGSSTNRRSLPEPPAAE